MATLDRAMALSAKVICSLQMELAVAAVIQVHPYRRRIRAYASVNPRLGALVLIGPVGAQAIEP